MVADKALSAVDIPSDDGLEDGTWEGGRQGRGDADAGFGAASGGGGGGGEDLICDRRRDLADRFWYLQETMITTLQSAAPILMLRLPGRIHSTERPPAACSLARPVRCAALDVVFLPLCNAFPTSLEWAVTEDRSRQEQRNPALCREESCHL